MATDRVMGLAVSGGINWPRCESPIVKGLATVVVAVAVAFFSRSINPMCLIILNLLSVPRILHLATVLAHVEPGAGCSGGIVVHVFEMLG